jgi:H+-transporting ATPase
MQSHFHVRNIGYSNSQMTSAVYLQVSIVSQALIFVTRSRSWSFLERPGLLLMSAFMIAQLVGNSGYFWLSAFLSILGFLLGFGGDFIVLFPIETGQVLFRWDADVRISDGFQWE